MKRGPITTYDARVVIEEYEFMTDICGLSTPRALLRLGVCAGYVQRRYEHLGLPVPAEVASLRGKPRAALERMTDERLMAVAS